MFNNISFKFIFSVLSFILISVKSQAVIFYYDEALAGETNMVKGIQRALIDTDVPYITTFTTQETDALQERLQGAPDTLITFGQSGLALLKKQGAVLSERGWCLGNVTHQIFEDHYQIPTGTTLFLPAHLKGIAMQERALPNHENIVWTNGVAMNLTKEDVLQSFEAQRSKIPNSGRYVVVILGGDAEDTDGTVMHYTEAESRELAAFVKNHYRDHHVIILNGPRTGKHDPQTKKVRKDVHRGSSPVDPVTGAFLEELKDSSSMRERITLSDFRFPGPDVPEGYINLYRPALGLMLHHDGFILIPGESNSMIADIVELGLQKKALIFPHNAMNSFHKANVEYAHQQQLVPILDSDFNSKQSEVPEVELPSANRQIAKAIADGICSQRQ